MMVLCAIYIGLEKVREDEVWWGVVYLHPGMSVFVYDVYRYIRRVI